MGIPNIAKIISHFALLKCICFRSCTTTIAAIKIDTNTENGTATSIGMKRMSKGTAINDSPKPNVERTNVARKIITKI